MKKIVISFVAVSMLLMSCGGGDSSESTQSIEDVAPGTEGELKFAITEKYSSLDPIDIRTVEEFHVASNIYESLLRFSDKDLSLQPMIAESWSISEDNLVYTLHLKKGIFFHDNDCFGGGKGRELKAADVIYSFHRTFSEESSYAHHLFIDIIKGADEALNGGNVSGLKIIDDYTIEIEINEPSANFINLLATIHSAVVAKEAIEKNVFVGTGPFTYQAKNDNDAGIVLTKNQNYHLSDKAGNKLPYLNSIAYNYVKSNKDQLNLFMDKKLSVVAKIPPESVKEIIESQIADFQQKPVKYVLGRSPLMTTSFLQLNTAKAPFDNIKVRQALAMAINKMKIVDDVLKGEASGPGNYGIVPPAIKNYDFSSIKGHEYNVTKAKKLLSEAGFPNGKGIPTLMFGTKKTHTGLRVALEIQKQLLSNLNINVEISSYTRPELNDMSDKSKLHLSFTGWLSEFPGPINFLSLFYGEYVADSIGKPSFPNNSRYKNPEFDKLYKEALVTIDMKKRHELCLMADQIVATDVPAIPLWYHENYQLIQSEVKGYQPNSMKIHYLTNTKLEEVKTEKPKTEK